MKMLCIMYILDREKGRKVVFDNGSYRVLFFQCIAEACQSLGLEVLTCCLMSNYYHLF
ncbi:MAG: hypothetical protein EXR81_02630 [Gammaproteobacteria bacterium]|nr:hypothetical protein [Gammaproteobacteria bacterium]